MKACVGGWNRRWIILISHHSLLQMPNPKVELMISCYELWNANEGWNSNNLSVFSASSPWNPHPQVLSRRRISCDGSPSRFCFTIRHFFMNDAPGLSSTINSNLSSTLIFHISTNFDIFIHKRLSNGEYDKPTRYVVWVIEVGREDIAFCATSSTKSSAI